MENNNFAVFILTHGRPDNVITYSTLIKCGYTGLLYFIVDNEDKTIERYRNNFGSDNIIVFDKKAMADSIDEGNNFDNRKVIIHARNACFNIAKTLGITYFIQLDDDYTSFMFRLENKLGFTPFIKNINQTFDHFINYFKSTDILTIAFSQGGDHIGGFAGTALKRKAMNSFFCSVDRPFQFVGSINEDVNTYTLLGSRGSVFLTFTSIQLVQKQTQSQGGGMTDEYLSSGTYVKSFHTVMMHPSSVKISMMQSNNPRIHHNIKWINTVPVIIDESHKKVHIKSNKMLVGNQLSFFD